MGNILQDSDQKIRTLCEYLKVQGRSDIADLLVDAKITEEKDVTFIGILFMSEREYKLCLNVSPSAFHTIQTNGEIKGVLKKSFLEVIPNYRHYDVHKVVFRILPA